MKVFKHRRSVPFIEQMQQTECGICCIAMLMRYYKSDEKITTIRKTLEAGRDGLRLSYLSKYMQEKGFVTKMYRAHYSYLGDLPLPAIIFWNNEHYVILEKCRKNNIVIVDPAFGRRKISKETLMECYSNVVMTVQPTEKFVPTKEKNDIWGNVLEHLKKRKMLLAKIIVYSLIVYGLQMGVPIIIQQMIDTISAGQSVESAGKYFILSISIVGVLGIINYIRSKRVLRLQIETDGFLSKGTFSKLLRLPYKYFEGRSSGDILFRLNSLNTIRDLLSEQCVQTVMQAGMLVFIVGYMMQKSILITVISMVTFIALGIFIMAIKPFITEVNYIDMMENTKLQTVQVETIYSIFAIKVAAMENTVKQNWLKAYERCLKAYEKKCNVINIYTTAITLIETVVPVILLGIGIFSSMNGGITIGETIAIYSLAGSFFATGVSLYNSYNDFITASAYMERIHDIIDSEDEANPEDPIEIKISGKVSIKNLSFAYTKYSENVLEDINLDIEEGEKIAIVGASGSGKSTLGKIILGLYEPTKGDILYDGVSIRNMNKRQLRKQIGVVPQDMTLFNKSILENIRMNQEDIRLEEVERAAEIAKIKEEIESMPMKYHTMVSDMGMNLSGGQRQRIALARAVVQDRDLIILDEATSALDYENERKISDFMASKKCTRIIIAHRLSTIMDADKIIVLDRGKIAEIGTHEDLLGRGGKYASLYNVKTKIAG